MKQRQSLRSRVGRLILAADASTYDEAAVQSIIDDGYAFYLANGYNVVG